MCFKVCKAYKIGKEILTIDLDALKGGEMGPRCCRGDVTVAAAPRPPRPLRLLRPDVEGGEVMVCSLPPGVCGAFFVIDFGLRTAGRLNGAPPPLVRGDFTMGVKYGYYYTKGSYFSFYRLLGHFVHYNV